MPTICINDSLDDRRHRCVAWELITLFGVIISQLIFVGQPSLSAELDSSLEIAYAYAKPNEGGLAMLTIDAQSGRITSQKSHYESSHCLHPKKVRPAGNGTFLVTHDSEKRPYVFVIDTIDPRTSKLVELPTLPDEIRIADNQAVLTCGQDRMVTLDIPSRTILGFQDLTDVLKPKGNGPEGILITKDKQFAIISLQKDSSGRKKMGGRIAVFKLPGMELLADVILARDYKAWEIKEFIRSQGPGPELIFLDESFDKLLVTMDHYGCVALMSWSEVLAGKLTTLTYVPTSSDQSWGSSFPDRGVQFVRNARPYCLILNAGQDGGAVIVDMLAEKVIHYIDTPPGLDVPIYVPKLSQVFTCCPGKTKRRLGKAVVKKFFPKKDMYVFDLPEDLTKTSVRQINTELPLFQLGRVERTSEIPFIVASAGKKEANRVMVFDPEKMAFVDDQPAIGRVAQFAHD